MEDFRLLKSESSAWVLGIVAVVVLATLAFAYLGWLGIGLLGLIGLLITTRLDLHGGHAVPDIGHGNSAVKLYAKQLEQQSARSSPEEKMAAAAKRAKRSRMLYAINTGLIGMMAFGFGLFFLHQL